MTWSLPTYRNSFHPGWFLLLLPPLFGWVRLAFDFDGVTLVADAARLLLAFLVVGPLILGRSREVSGGARRWMKELRIHWWPALVGVGVPGLLVLVRWQGQIPESLWIWILGTSLVGALMSGAVAFGEEFEQRTLAGWMSQPGSRGALYRQKLAVLAVMLVWIAANLSLLLERWRSTNLGDLVETLRVVWAMVLLIFCTAPLYTLLTRSTLAGAIFVAAVPLVLLSVAALSAAAVERWSGLTVPPQWLQRAAWLVPPAYAALGVWLGWRRFATLEIRDAGAGHGGAHPLSFPVDRMLLGLLPGRAWAQLLRKELRLHVVPWLVAGIFSGLWILWMIIRAVRSDSGDDATLASGFGLLAVIMGLMSLIVSGAACVAEERQLGTLDWQLTQPISLSRQWWTKLAVALGLFVILGVALPFGLLVLSFGFSGYFGGWGLDDLWVVSLYGGAVLLAFSLAAYASSFCRNTMKASATAIVLGLTLGALPFPGIALTGIRMDAIGNEPGLSPAEAPAWAPSAAGVRWIVSLQIIALAVGLIVLLLGMGRRNFAKASVAREALVKQWAILALVLLGSLLVTGETLVRLTRLQFRSHAAQVEVQRGIQVEEGLRELVRWHLDRGSLREDFLERLQLPRTANLQTTLTALGSLEPGVREQWVHILFKDVAWNLPAGRISPVVTDPLLGLRHGISMSNLIQMRLQEATRTNAAGFAPRNVHPLDPLLRKRYGLPAAPAAAPPTPPP